MTQINNWGANLESSRVGDLMIHDGSRYTRMMNRKHDFYQWDFEKSGTLASSGAGAGSGLVNVSDYASGRSFTTGTDTTGYAGILWTRLPAPTASTISLSLSINLLNLSDMTDEYDFYFGCWSSSFNTPLVGDFWGFKYDRNASVNWLCSTALAGVETATDSTIAVSTDTTSLRCIFDSATPSVKFYIDEVLVATNTTNMPTANPMFNRILMLKSAGTTARTVQCYTSSTVIVRT